MARQVYSSQFLLVLNDESSKSFEVPDGFTAVIRQLSLTVQASEALFSINVQDSDEAPAIAIHITTISAIYETQHTQGRWVVPEGGTITLYCSDIGAEAVSYVGGYLLANS